MYEKEYWKEYDEEEEEDFEVIDALCAYIRHIEEGRVKILNFPVYRRMMDTASRLRDLLPSIGEGGGGKVWSEILEIFGCGTVTVEVDTMSFTKCAVLTEILKETDSFEVYPTVNGKIRALFGFDGVLRSI